MENAGKTSWSILVVEDDAGLNRLIQKRLQKEGYHIEQAFNGEEALGKALLHPFALMLLDYQIPLMSAPQLIDELERLEKPVPFIIMTGHGDEKIAVEMMKCGARDYIIKDSAFIDILPSVIARVISELERDERLAKTENSLRESEDRFRRIAENAQDVIFRIKLPERIYEYISPASSVVFGYEPDEFYHSPDLEHQIIHPDWHDYISKEWEFLLDGKVSPVFEYQVIHKSGEYRWINQRNVLVFNEDATPGALEGIVTDVTEQKNKEDTIKDSLKEKEVLLKEIHHRVKNNLQIVSSLLSLQSSYVVNEKDKALFEDSMSRVRSIGLVHEKLYQSKNLSRIDFKEFITDLKDELVVFYHHNAGNVMFRLDIQNVILSIDIAVPCALIINELLSNALKYAFPESSSGEVVMAFITDEEGQCLLSVADNGVGLDESIDLHNSDSLGLQLVSTLSRQLNGTIVIERNSGTKFIITFPNPDSPGGGKVSKSVEI